MALDEKPLHLGVVLTNAELYFLKSARLSHVQYKHTGHALYHKRQAKPQFHVLTVVGLNHVNLELNQVCTVRVVSF